LLNKKLRKGIGDVRLVKEESQGGKVKALKIKKKREIESDLDQLKKKE